MENPLFKLCAFNKKLLTEKSLSVKFSPEFQGTEMIHKADNTAITTMMMSMHKAFTEGSRS